MQDFEKLGAFYLGKRYDLGARKLQDELILYDSKDLTTHAVCVGMTGSGKTGLCLSLLEEAAIDGIPAIMIDPKGDLPNLALAFPKLDAASFRPWIDESEATRSGATPDQYATQVAKRWKEGLASWGQGPKRVKRYCDEADIAIYTPGSNAGLPLTVLKSFAAPSAELLQDTDAYRQRVTSATSGLLALLGIDADPVRDREHILIATLLDKAWRAGKDVDIAGLIGQIQEPPVDRIGVVDLDTFYPPKDRTRLAMSLNNLLASPSFAGWMQGESLDIGRMLSLPEGKTRLSIISIAHLSDAERMFFVTILLNEIVSWVRTQPGTSSLRALLYMDEVFGFFPPVANPPSKMPMLTLLKQARAHGLGVVLATQNPVDLDYKGLSNIGTWFLGRLQTARDKDRVLEGLEGAAVQTGSEFDRAKMEQTLAGLGKRVFLMNNVHEDEPVTFQTRWAMSYLRGPLTRSQIKRLMDPRRLATDVAKEKGTASKLPAGRKAQPAKGTVRSKPRTTDDRKEMTPGQGDTREATRPKLPSRVEEHFLAADCVMPEGSRPAYRPALLARVHLHYVRANYQVDTWHDLSLLVELSERMSGSPWTLDDTLQVNAEDLALEDESDSEAEFIADHAALSNSKSFTRWKKQCATFCYQTRPMSLWRCQELKAYSRPGESVDQFRAQLRHTAREHRDRAVEKLRGKYATRFAKAEERIAGCQARVAKEESERGRAYVDTGWSFGRQILDAILGRKRRRTKSSRGAREMGNAYKQTGDVRAAKARLAEEKKKYKSLVAELAEKTKEIENDYCPEALELEPLELKPRKSDIEVESLEVVWLPWYIDLDEQSTPAYEVVAFDSSDSPSAVEAPA